MENCLTLWTRLLACGFALGVAGQGIKVFSLQEDIWAPPTTEIFVRYNLSLKIPQPSSNGWEVTICYRVRVVALSPFEMHFSLAISDFNSDSFLTYRQANQNWFQYDDKIEYGFMDFKTKLELRKWVHYCHQFFSGQFRAFVDGEEVVRGPIANKGAPVPLNGTIVLGQEQDTTGGGFDRAQVLRGRIAQVNMWNRTLGEGEIRREAFCQSYELGDVFSTDREEVELFGVFVETVRLDSFCQPYNEYVILPESRDMKASHRACQRVGGRLFGPETRRQNRQMYLESLQFNATCPSNFHMWVGLTDALEEDVWRRFSDNKTVVETSFVPGFPNGGQSENCIYMSRISGLWEDISCAREWFACAACIEDFTRPLVLRGLCEKKEAETMFETLGYRQQKPFFHGYYGKMIFQTASGHWALLDTVTNTTLATLELEAADDYPLGRHAWTLRATVCDRPEGSVAELSLSACYDSEYACANGECIAKELRCDTRDDCSDLSDESGCSLMQVPDGYRDQRPPEGDLKGGALQVAATVNILRFVEISDVRRMVRMEVEVDVKWKDARLRYLNLKDTLEWNKLTEEEKALIWRPQFEFPNVYDGRVDRFKEQVFVEKIGGPLEADFNDAKMDVVYSGEAAMFQQQQHYSGSFACSFDVFHYPFDIQVCKVLVQLSSVREEVVRFSEEEARVVYLEDINLPSYTVTRYEAFVTTRGTAKTKYSVMEVEFELTRRWTVIVLSIFFPTTLLLIVGYATLFVSVNQLEVRLGVSVTTLLVLYTLFNNTSDALPPTAYIKLIDVWFFACILMLFAVIVTHVYVEHLDNTRTPEGGKAGGSVLQVLSTRGKVEEDSWKKVEAWEDVGEGGWRWRSRWWWGWAWMRDPDGILRAMRGVVVPFSMAVFMIVYWSIMFG